MAQDMDSALQENELDLLVGRLMARRAAAMRSIARMFGVQLPPEGEADRLAAIKAAALPPESCGPDMPAAPARGPLQAIQPMSMVRTEDGYDLRHTGFRGRDAARARDVFDLMADQARRAGGFDPFTSRQKGIARAYAAMVERHSSVGLKGRSVEVLSGRTGRGGDGVMDRILAEGRAIEAMRSAVGDALALEVRRVRKAGRTAIRLIDLVDAVCLHGLAIDHILKRAGWAPDGATRATAQEVLASALDRMAMVV